MSSRRCSTSGRSGHSTSSMSHCPHSMPTFAGRPNRSWRAHQRCSHDAPQRRHRRDRRRWTLSDLPRGSLRDELGEQAAMACALRRFARRPGDRDHRAQRRARAPTTESHLGRGRSAGHRRSDLRPRPDRHGDGRRQAVHRGCQPLEHLGPWDDADDHWLRAVRPRQPAGTIRPPGSARPSSRSAP